MPNTPTEPAKVPKGNALPTRASVWVLMGFVLWIGFFIGAIILHAMAK